MALTDSEIVQTLRDLLAHNGDAPFNLTRPDVRAAVAAVDQWCTDNAVAYNAALPVAFRTQATAAQKAALLAFVALRRAGR